ncbi:Cmx/CmrA family chloramphenicol efflux MFS transporter [Pseudonocardia xinjiangensis]|uniref:MFS transporter n=1 Tax=Pseudonocardia xinjiangensis TaxID=75289 RepID=A0ABX1RFB3_9PSEU|nr:Cmx/CmrA family chloramphenicol efflux MFS transporter [Pseudonocardia xinjiangensis]NMH79093.1 MFS transporter [Pseudonocardia xinjiangensis]
MPGVAAPSLPARIPRVVPVLALSIFALGTSEFMIAGLLPRLAADLRVGIPEAGYLISAFAVGMIVGAPAMAVLTLRLPRRTTLLAALAVFVVGHVVSALSPEYGVLLVARVVTAVATGAFWAVAAVVTVSVVAPELRAMSLSVLLGGLTVANVAGVPLGTLVGQQFGWRSAFWAVGALAAVSAVGVVLSVPRRTAGGTAPRLAAELAAFRRGRLWLALGTTALYQSAMIGAFSYIAPLLTDVTGLDERWVPGVLLGFGLGSLVGVVVGGRLADPYPWPTLFGGLTAAGVLLGLIGLFAPEPVVVVGLVVLLGAVAFIAGAPLNARVFALAGAAPTLASATNTSAFNVGNSLGPALGGLAIGAGWGLTAPAYLGVLLAAAAIAVALVSWRLDRREVRAGE